MLMVQATINGVLHMQKEGMCRCISHTPWRGCSTFAAASFAGTVMTCCTRLREPYVSSWHS